MDPFTKKRLESQFGGDPLFDLYMFVFEESSKKPWVTEFEGDERERHKAIVYETMSLVREWYNKEVLQ